MSAPLPFDVKISTLETDRLLLRPWQMDDLDDFYAYASVDGVGQMAGWLPHKSKDESREILLHWLEDGNELALLHKADRRVIGSLGIHPSLLSGLPEHKELRILEIGYTLSKTYWGKGLMPEAVQRMLAYLFSECGLDAVSVSHYDFNHQSRRVIEKCGFTQVDSIPHTAKRTGISCQLLRYVLYREDWKKQQLQKLVMRRIRKEETDAALALAWEVFSEFEAPVYGAKGTETFRRDIIDHAEFRSNVESGACPVWCVFDGGKPVCIIGLRLSRTHINLVFTKKEYQRRGLASALMTQVLSELKAENPALHAVTLNSSPYGLPFYLKFGFVPTNTEQCVDGIRYTPMQWTYAENS